MARTAGTTLALSKHEGAGNDFLVALDPEGSLRLTAALARAVCDRHLGVGADGVIVAGPGRTGADLSMVLRNADGSEAEMSGNGMRCLAQAAVEAGLVQPPDFTVATVAGVRTVSYQPGERPGHGWARVEMGAVRLGEERPHALAGHRAREVEVGNPHLVVVGAEDPSTIEVREVGPRLEAAPRRGHQRRVRVVGRRRPAGAAGLGARGGGDPGLRHRELRGGGRGPGLGAGGRARPGRQPRRYARGVAGADRR